MSLFHLIFGLAAFIVFLITGQFMRADFPDKEELDQGLRMLMRSRHIYILFSALLHFMVGLYLRSSEVRWRRVAQRAGSASLAAGTLMLIWAFVLESYYTNAFTNVSRNGLYITLLGVALHAAGGFRAR